MKKIKKFKQINEIDVVFAIISHLHLWSYLPKYLYPKAFGVKESIKSVFRRMSNTNDDTWPVRREVGIYLIWLNKRYEPMHAMYRAFKCWFEVYRQGNIDDWHYWYITFYAWLLKNNLYLAYLIAARATSLESKFKSKSFRQWIYDWPSAIIEASFGWGIRGPLSFSEWYKASTRWAEQVKILINP